jgi:hypothetical protein
MLVWRRSLRLGYFADDVNQDVHGHSPVTSSVGTVINSMQIGLRKF